MEPNDDRLYQMVEALAAPHISLERYNYKPANGVAYGSAPSRQLRIYKLSTTKAFQLQRVDLEGFVGRAQKFFSDPSVMQAAEK